jgi:hypothetical protein
VRNPGLALAAGALLVAAFAAGAPAAAQVGLTPSGALQIPGELRTPISFAWAGSLEGATQALAQCLGYTAWANTASGLPMPDPHPVVTVNVGFQSASPADIVVALNQQAVNRAVVVLDPQTRSIGVVYYGV